METTPEQATEGKAVVSVLASVLERLVKSNSANANNGGGASCNEITKFHALKAPGISIKQYLERIHKYASCSTECFVLALIYIDRLIQNNNFILSELNVHRVVITAILLAAKFFDDAYYNNAYYAKVGGVLVSEMNGLEVEFLFRINFSLHVKPEVFLQYQDELVSHVLGASSADMEQQIQQPPQQPQQQPQPQLVHAVGGEMHHHHQSQMMYQAVNIIPVTTDFTQQTDVVMTNNTQPCGNVTPSPPQSNIDYSQPHQQHYHQQPQQPLHDMKHEQQQQQQQQQYPIQHLPTQPIIVPTTNNLNSNHQYNPYQDTMQQRAQQVSPQKNFQNNNNNRSNTVSLSQTKDLLYATCCPYGGRLNANSSPVLFNTVTRIFQ